jgi:hypothetical protein
MTFMLLIMIVKVLVKGFKGRPASKGKPAGM